MALVTKYGSQQVSLTYTVLLHNVEVTEDRIVAKNDIHFVLDQHCRMASSCYRATQSMLALFGFTRCN